MIPASFEYVRAGSVEEAIEALREHGDDASLLAGGHSLLPLMKLRLAAPEVLIDLGRIDTLRGVRDTNEGRLAIGGMTTHQEVIDDQLVREHCGVLVDVLTRVGDAQVRHRGTLGGAVAHGDAASDVPALLLALEAVVVLQGPDGRREVPANEMFRDYLTTAIADNEVLVEVQVPKLAPSWGWRYEKFTRVSQAWAIVGSVALVERTNGTIDQVRVGLTNMGTVPYRASATEASLVGNGVEAIAAAAEHAAEGTSPGNDLNATSEFREHLARVLTRRALEHAAG